MIEIDCATCERRLEPTASPLMNRLPLRGPVGPYPSQLLTCPTCGAAWEQRANGSLYHRER
jgi:hypothetical protein